jgi:hypothetical protein
MGKKVRSKCPGGSFADAALEQIEETIKAVKLCEGELTADEYRKIRGRLGHLMDMLYKAGGALSKST